MANAVELNKEETNIRVLLGEYLAGRPTDLHFASNDTSHIDQDTLSAFTEGSLNERESTPVVGHLVRCSFCRHITTELVRLDLAFAETPAIQATQSEAPGKISEVLSGLFSKILVHPMEPFLLITKMIEKRGIETKKKKTNFGET